MSSFQYHLYTLAANLKTCIQASRNHKISTVLHHIVCVLYLVNYLTPYSLQQKPL